VQTLDELGLCVEDALQVSVGGEDAVIVVGGKGGTDREQQEEEEPHRLVNVLVKETDWCGAAVKQIDVKQSL
jgi:hypothetical protein